MGQTQAVKGANNAASTTITVTTAATQSGAQLVLFVCGASNFTVSSVNDGKSGTWTTRTGAAQKIAIVDNLSCAQGITSVTLTTTGASDFMWGALIERDDIAGYDQVTSVVTAAVNPWVSNTSAAMAQSQEIGFGFAGSAVSGNQLTAAGVGWTAVSSATITGGVCDDASGDSGFIESRLFSAGGTTSATGVCVASTNVNALVLYKLAATPGKISVLDNPGKGPGPRFRVFQQGVLRIQAQDPFASPILATTNHPGRGPGKRPFPQLKQGIAAPAVTVTGTLATTNTDDTSSAAGTTTVLGTLAKTNADDTSAASGTTTVLGTLARTNANDTLSAAGTTTVTGTLARTNANDTSAASGTPVVVGSLATTNANDSLSASGDAGVTPPTPDDRPIFLGRGRQWLYVAYINGKKLVGPIEYIEEQVREFAEKQAAKALAQGKLPKTRIVVQRGRKLDETRQEARSAQETTSEAPAALLIQAELRRYYDTAVARFLMELERDEEEAIILLI